jgi:hypothetical protein
MDYSLGDTVTYRTSMGALRSVVVVNRGEENGVPVFDGYLHGYDCARSSSWVWGYEDQIVSVMSGAEA